jgi:hypothetical protein
MSTLTITVIIAPIIAISSCIIGDCLERVFGFGYLFPTMGQLIGLAYMKLTKPNV